MKRLIDEIVFCGLVTAWRLATVPTSRSPLCVNATTDGVVRAPSAFSMTVGSPPSSTAIQLLVVPRSIPIVLPIVSLLLCVRKNLSGIVADLLRKSSARTVAREPARAALGPACVTDAAPVAQQVEVQLELLAGRCQRQHRVVQAPRTARPGAAVPGARRPARRACRPARRACPSANRSTHAAVLRPTPGSEQR